MDAKTPGAQPQSFNLKEYVLWGHTKMLRSKYRRAEIVGSGCSLDSGCLA